MSESTSSPPPVLHIWPPCQAAWSLEPACVAALLYLATVIPGRFSISYTTNPDLSPSGRLPYLTHGLHSTASLQSIKHYVDNLGDALDIDAALSPSEKAQAAARIAHVEAEYGDLVAHTLYAISTNWWKVTQHALASLLPVPQRYYVPGHIRESYKTRLEAAELWDVPGVERDDDEDRISQFRKSRQERKKKETKAQKSKRTFEREKVLHKARAFLDIYAKLLGDRRFFQSNSDRPTSLDIVFAAHTHILLNIKFEDSLIPSLIAESYPALVAHAAAVQSFAFPNPQAFPPIATQSSTHWLRSLFTWPASAFWKRTQKTGQRGLSHQQPAYARFGWFAVVLAGTVLYLCIYGLGPGLQVRIVPVEEPPEEEVLDYDEEDYLEEEAVEEGDEDAGEPENEN